MKQFYELDGLTASISREGVFKSLDCREDSPVYEDIAEAFDEIYGEMLSLAAPKGVLGFGVLPETAASEKYGPGTPVIYLVTSIGGGMSRYSTRAFQEGDYVRGMLSDAMADEALFSLDDQAAEQLKEICAEHQVGILARLEAPHHLPMEIQKTAWEYLGLQDRLGIGISSGYMFDPVKTSCQVFVLTNDTGVFRAEHDCRSCPNVSCKRRRVPDLEIVVKTEDGEKRIPVKEKESLLDALIRGECYVSAVCGGRGRCGRCRVQVLSGSAAVTASDEGVFSKEELAAGWHLSCTLYPQEELVIALPQGEAGFEVLSSYTKEDGGSETQTEDSAFDIAADIGTTTIVLALLGKSSHKMIHTVTGINGQRVFGADVISRIKASSDGKKQELQELIRRDLCRGIRRLTRKAGISPEQIRNIVISGNTTMGHLLMGYDCRTLGVYPFTPVNIGFITGTAGAILGDELSGNPGCGRPEDSESSGDTANGRPGGDSQVTLLPGISTYVGGDIVSGMYACGFGETSDICLLVDLGTNGEMALGNKDRILVTSTAAGPAFEGGNITWGTGSIPGAICSVTLQNGKPQITTIQDQAPVGICGTGVVEITAELVREGIVSDSGALDEDYFEEGFPLAGTADGKKIVFTQKDIRELQLAKAAIRAGVETLLLRYGIRKEEVSRVYLAGGFGYRLDVSRAIAIGMLPAEFAGRITAAGNTSLAGAVQYLSDPDGKSRIQRLTEISQEIGLSADKAFNDFYMDAMFFTEEAEL